MQDTFSPSSSYSLITTIGMYQHTDTKPTKKGVFFHSKEDYSYLNLLIECNTNNKEIVAPLWDGTVRHVATFAAEVLKMFGDVRRKRQRWGFGMFVLPARSEQSIHQGI